MKAAKPKPRKYVVSLSECEMRRLSVYAEQNGIDRPTALARILHRGLREAASLAHADNTDENQLRLFDAVQIDIFNNTAKVNPQED
jgi:hypothetical protein